MRRELRRPSPEEVVVNEQIQVRRQSGGQIWSHIRKKGLIETPEERVRQEYLCILVNEYGFSLDQIDEEVSVTGRGSGGARADFVIWRTPQDKAGAKKPLIKKFSSNASSDKKNAARTSSPLNSWKASWATTRWKTCSKRRKPPIKQTKFSGQTKELISSLPQEKKLLDCLNATIFLPPAKT